MMLARQTLKCVASSQKPQNNIVAARKAFEKRRLASVKENFNKLVLIATSDTKELTDFMKELDELHKKQFENIVPIKKETQQQQQQQQQQQEENVFLDQQ